MNPILREYAARKYKLCSDKSKNSPIIKRKIEKVKVQNRNLGLTADSWIAKCGIEGYKEDSMEKLGLKDLENGHQDA